MISIEKWSGLVTNASPYSLPGGACVRQVNLQCRAPGQLQTRGGLQAAVVTGESQVVMAIRYSLGTERIIYQCGTSISMATVP